MKITRVQAVVLASALVAGYTGAAVVSAWSAPAIQVAEGFGPGDGLTRYVVRAAAGPATDQLLTELGAVDGVVSAQLLHGGAALVATDGLAPHHLEAVPGVADAEFSPQVPVLGAVTDPYFPQYGWNLDNTGINFYNQAGTADADVDAPAGWDGGTGQGRIVAVLDTGFDSAHLDLAGALWTNPAEPCGTSDTDGNGLAGDCHGWNFAANNADVDNGSLGEHGTAVSGVVGARANNGVGSAGVAPDVTIMPLVIGSGEGVDVVLGAQAIRYAVDHGADVINASWGGAFSGYPLQLLRDAVAYAAAHDVVVIAAAGNDQGNRDTSILYPASLTDPNVITVGSSTAADGVSASSAYGATSVELFAPGNLVATTWNDGGYRLVSGTSIAAPHVAAAYALYRAQRPDAGYAEVRQALLGDVDPVAAFEGRSVTGGRLTLRHLAEDTPAEIGYRFASMTAPAGPVTPRVTATGDESPGDWSVTLGLGMEADREIWAVADKALTLGGATVTTDDAGEATFDLGLADSPADLDLSPTLELGNGRYVLSVQLHRDGDPAGHTFAAPLLIGTAAETDPGGSDGGPGTGGSDDGGSDDGGSGDGGSGDDSGGSEGGSDGPGTDDGGSGDSGSGDSGSGGGSDDGDSDRGADDGSDDADGAPGDGPGGDDRSDDSADGPSDGSDGADGSPGPVDGADGSDPGDGSGGSDGGSEAPGDAEDRDDSVDGPPTDDGGSVTYPGVGPFRITGMSPIRVDTAGGTQVTLTGTALPLDARVRIGETAAAAVVRSSATELVFVAPARVAGVYDVHVFARDDRTSVLEDALTYTDAPIGPGSGADDDGGNGTPGPGGSGSDPGTDDGSAGDGEPVVRSGPNGERLVRTTKFAALGWSFWTLDCSTSCSGMVL